MKTIIQHGASAGGCSPQWVYGPEVEERRLGERRVTKCKGRSQQPGMLEGLLRGLCTAPVVLFIGPLMARRLLHFHSMLHRTKVLGVCYLLQDAEGDMKQWRKHHMPSSSSQASIIKRYRIHIDRSISNTHSNATLSFLANPRRRRGSTLIPSQPFRP